jgi:hypothetical protein
MSLACHNARLRVGGEVGLTELTREGASTATRKKERRIQRERERERFRSAKEIEGEARHPELFTGDCREACAETYYPRENQANP